MNKSWWSSNADYNNLIEKLDYLDSKGIRPDEIKVTTSIGSGQYIILYYHTEAISFT